MSIKLVGVSNNQAQVNSDLAAVLITARPDQVLNYQSTSGVSGNLTTVVVNGPVWSMRNTGLNPIIIRRLSVSFRVTTGFTSAQAMRFAVFRAIGFTASDTGGTALYTVLQNRHRTDSTPVAYAPDIRIATTAALTAGTRTLESVPLAAVQTYVAATTAGVGLAIPETNLIHQEAGDHPVVLAANEGLVLVNQVVMGAAGVGVLLATVEWAEATAY